MKPLKLAVAFFCAAWSAFRCALTHLKLLHRAGQRAAAFADPALATTRNALASSATTTSLRMLSPQVGVCGAGPCSGPRASVHDSCLDRQREQIGRHERSGLAPIGLRGIVSWAPRSGHLGATTIGGIVDTIGVLTRFVLRVFGRFLPANLRRAADVIGTRPTPTPTGTVAVVPDETIANLGKVDHIVVL